jgi:hypothetical protein
MKFRPIALLCALALIVWGGIAVASVVAQVQIHQHTPWPTVHLDRFGTPADRAAWTTYVALAASAVGSLAVLAGLVGLVRRAGLHLGAVVALLSLALTAVDLTVIHNDTPVSWSWIATSYRDRILWRPLDVTGAERWWFFVTDLMLPLAALPLVLWLLVLLTGAGKRRPGAASAAAVAGPHAAVVADAIPDQDYFRAVRGDRVVADEDVTPAEVAVEPAPALSAEDAAGDAVADDAVADEAEADQADEAEVHAPAEEAAVAPAVAGPASEHDAIWFVTVQGADHGPYTRAQLRGYLDEGRLHVGTITHLAGGPDQALADVLS